MLILSRKSGEDLVLKVSQETIVIRICKIKGNRAAVGIDASRQVDVRRGELSTAIPVDGRAYGDRGVA